MLRVLVLTLVLVNLALFGLQLLERHVPQPATQETGPASAGQVATIRMVSEANDPALSVSGTAECFTAGPFLSPEAKSEAMHEIARSAVAIAERSTEAEVRRGIWVYLPVQPDYVTARSMALTLRDAGFADANVVMEGDWKHSVSIGFFANQANAQALYEEARSLGFKAERRDELAFEPRYWIDYEQRAGAPYVRPGASSAIAEVQHRAVPCAAGY